MPETTLPSGDSLPPDVVRRDWFKAVLDVPPPVGGGEMHVLAPRGWQRFPLPAELRPPRPGDAARLVVQLNGPETGGFSPFIQIQVARLDREITAFNWLRFYCQRMRFSPQRIDEVSDHVADALVGFEIAGEVAAARVAVRLYGDLAFIVVAGDAAERYDEIKHRLGFIVRSFVLDGRAPGGNIEAWAGVSDAHGPRFEVPRSWKVDRLSSPSDAFGAYDLTNFGPQEAWFGQMRLRWIDRSITSSDTDEAKKVLSEILQGSVQLGKTIANSTMSIPGRGYTITAAMSREAKLNGQSREAKLNGQSREAKLNGQSREAKLDGQSREAKLDGQAAPLELFQALLTGEKGRAFLFLLTPSRSASFYWWAVNRRAADIVAGTLE